MNKINSCFSSSQRKKCPTTYNNNLLLLIRNKVWPEINAHFTYTMTNCSKVEMFHLNTIEQLLHFVEQFDQLEVCQLYIDF